MKLRITLHTKGFLIAEIMIAFSLLTLFSISTITLLTSTTALREFSFKKLERLSFVTMNISSSTLFSKSNYGNDSRVSHLDPLTLVDSDFANAWGRETCDPRDLLDTTKTLHIYQNSQLDLGNSGTDLEVRNRIVYLATDSSIAGLPDLYIWNTEDPHYPYLLSVLNSGPGFSAIEVAGHYVYAANLGTTNQLQIIDISSREAPVVVAKLKVPVPTASTSAPFATSIFYKKGFIYLGTEKWEGSEFYIIDVKNPLQPQILGSMETGTQVNDIYVYGNKAYVTGSKEYQMQIFDVSNPQTIILTSILSPTGWETQTGKSISLFEGNVGWGRTTGGFNVITNHELFIAATSSSISKDVPGGVYGLQIWPDVVAIITRLSGQEFQIWDKQLAVKILQLSLNASPIRLGCDGKDVYVATTDEKGFLIIKN
jgi:hypothetical protein